MAGCKQQWALGLSMSRTVLTLPFPRETTSTQSAQCHEDNIGDKEAGGLTPSGPAGGLTPEWLAAEALFLGS